MSPDWSAAVAAAHPSLVLPDGERRARVVPPGPLRALSVLALDAQHAVAVVEDGDGGRWTVPLHRGPEGVRRSGAGDGTAQALVALLTDPTAARGDFRVTAWHAEPLHGERAVTVDQTNESVVVGERAVVKWAVHLPRDGEPGSPAGERIAALVRAGFDAMPRAWAVVEHLREGASSPVLVATVVDLLPGALDGWDWAVDDVRRLARGEPSPEDAVAPARVLGEITARLHVALAGEGTEPATSEEVAGWRERALAELAEARAVLDGPEGERLAQWSSRIASSYDGMLATSGTVLAYVHGDLHVGQVLRHLGGYAVTDFDGNPVLTSADRVRRRPPAVDVAGMCASLDHVGRVVLHRTEEVDAEAVRAWIAEAQQRFLAAYRHSLASAGWSGLLDDRLLEPLRLAQEVREYLYAVRHLPHWVYVPDLALSDLLTDTSPPED